MPQGIKHHFTRLLLEVDEHAAAGPQDAPAFRNVAEALPFLQLHEDHGAIHDVDRFALDLLEVDAITTI